LIESFRASARKLGVSLRVFGSDATELSSALQVCDERFKVRPVGRKGYIEELLSVARKKRVGLLVPTVDLDLRLLAEQREKFERLGCRVLISSPKVVDICQDKRKTYRFLVRKGFDTPLTMSPAVALKRRGGPWPCFLKPRDGYASRGSAVAKNRRELLFFSRRVPNCVVQELVEGQEYTCDVYVDFAGKVRSVVPRKRIEVRAGEMSKGRIDRDRRIMAEGARLIEELGAGPGVITLQLFRTPQHKIKFIEINPRFGGGVPLSIRAGADFPRWIIQEVLGRRPRIRFDGFKDGLMMLRYDSEIWLGA
jgi:carbamoyl-phosphate synthase large subunit